MLFLYWEFRHPQQANPCHDTKENRTHRYGYENYQSCHDSDNKGTPNRTND
jgi:hypothetical protein